MSQPNPEHLFEDLHRGDRNALAKCITLVESKKADHQRLAETILDQCMPHTGKAVRLGITGVPGVGKSTFIESFGTYLINDHHKKVAVLAIDPSSSRSKGSILGDKTRMAALAGNDRAFIRPSPSSGSLGGVGLATRESIALCEAANYDVIIVETVGVGQSETEVRELVDFFLLLMLPGAGDELQGIKRGIIELADAIFINKADGDQLKAAREARSAYASALSLFQQHASSWKTKVALCSALNGENLDEAWNTVNEYLTKTKKSGAFAEQRQNQLRRWFDSSLRHRMLSNYVNKDDFDELKNQFESAVVTNKFSPRKASRLLLEALNKQAD